MFLIPCKSSVMTKKWLQLQDSVQLVCNYSFTGVDRSYNNSERLDYFNQLITFGGPT